MHAASIIQDKKDEIVGEWLNIIKNEFPQVKQYGKSAIQDDVPVLLDALVEVLETNGDMSLFFAGGAHGRQRTNFDEYSLLHVIREYRILKRLIFKYLDKHGKVHPWERDKIMYAIDQATEEGAEKYFQMQRQKVAAEKEIAEESVRRFQIDHEIQGDFINSVSHDLNNPINNIKFAVQLMEAGPGPDEFEKLLKIIASNTAKAERLIRDLLDVNKVGSGARLPLDVRECELISELRSDLEVYRMQQGLKVSFKTPLKKLPIKVDCEAIMRAVNNLVDNALKYGDNSRPVEIECIRKDGIVAISVSNQGPAIPLDQQAHIFTRFYRINDSPNKGWGIGLPLVRAITEAHGGKVSVESIEGERTTFTIEIPADSTPFSEAEG